MTQKKKAVKKKTRGKSSRKTSWDSEDFQKKLEEQKNAWRKSLIKEREEEAKRKADFYDSIE
ncbi:hypothetical protein MYX07_07180 [Patescibacteria group bacterium AH-259-L07]|nr:hypothetical protein [Patescibacteria group bacterium AH-259-L07]